MNIQQIFLAFITGLTTGGISCLAVQGGLLASSLAHQLEQELPGKNKNKGGKTSHVKTSGTILLFLSAKLAAYTLLGALLGALGQVLTLNPMVRGVLLVAIGVFMAGNALRMFNVHPFFRIFAFEPPRAVRQLIRKVSKDGKDWFSPLFLGGLTVLIPCGVTQAMMAVALGTGSALAGAALMFAFVLGTSPVFFLAATLVMQVGARLEKWLMRAVALVMLVLGVLSVGNGMNLMGVGLVFPGTQSAREVVPTNPTALVSGENEIILYAENDGYAPRQLFAPAGVDLTLILITEDTFSCARAFVIPALGVEVVLPQTGSTPISIPAQEAGKVIAFTCSMGMYTGEIVFGQ